MAEDNVPNYLIAFLPWVTIKRKAKIGRVVFTPFHLEDGKISPELRGVGTELERILSGYVDIKVRPVRNWTVVCVPTEDGESWQLTDDDHDRVARATNFLLLAAFACNQYFSSLGSYVNSAAFELYWQRFVRGATWIAPPSTSTVF